MIQERLAARVSAVDGLRGRLGGGESAFILPTIGWELAECHGGRSYRGSALPRSAVQAAIGDRRRRADFGPSSVPVDPGADRGLYRCKRTGVPGAFQDGMTDPVFSRATGPRILGRVAHC